MRVDTYIFNDQAHKINQMHVLFNQEPPYITRMSRTRQSELNLDCQNPSEEYNMLLLCFSTPRLLFLHG